MVRAWKIVIFSKYQSAMEVQVWRQVQKCPYVKIQNALNALQHYRLLKRGNVGCIVTQASIKSQQYRTWHPIQRLRLIYRLVGNYWQNHGQVYYYQKCSRPSQGRVTFRPPSGNQDIGRKQEHIALCVCFGTLEFKRVNWIADIPAQDCCHVIMALMWLQIVQLSC